MDPKGLSDFGTITVRDGHAEETLELLDFERRIEVGEIDLFTEVRFPPLTGAEFRRVGEVEVFRRLVQPRGIHFQRTFHLGRIPWITLGLVALNLGIFLLQGGAGRVDVGGLVAFGAKAGPLIADLGQLWRLVTANFVHADAFHIGFNLFVLFHFGAVVENAFRPLDAVWVLVAAAFGTTLASLAATDAITLGASGVAYGVLGSAVVFGWKYRKMLPPRHRAVLGAPILPTVLVFLYMGWTSQGVDNWGHMGGLLAGAVATAPLQPRLLGPRPPLAQVLRRRVAPLLAVALVIAGGSWWLGSRPPSLVPLADGRLGLSYAVPRGWQERSPGIFDNALPLHARAAVAITVRPGVHDPDLLAVATTWSEDELRRRMQDGRIQKRRADPIELLDLGGMDAAGRRLELLVDGVPTVLTAIFAAKDDRLYSFVLSRPVSLPAYDRILDGIVASVRPLDGG